MRHVNIFVILLIAISYVKTIDLPIESKRFLGYTYTRYSRGPFRNKAFKFF